MRTKVKSTEAKKVQGGQQVSIKPPNIQTAEFGIIGTAPYVHLRFSEKAMNAMHVKHEAGSVAKKGSARVARNFDDDYEQAFHKDAKGRAGIPAGAFRAAMISACRLCGFKMTIAKLSVFVIADTFDRVDGVPLVLIEGKPERTEMFVRNATGVADLRVRPMWREWSAKLRIQFDADQMALADISNLLHRVGIQVGIGEGRPDSKNSCGMGWGTFSISAKK